MIADSTLIVAVITGVTGVSGALGGAFLTWKLKENTDRMQWWRQQQLAAVSQLITNVGMFVHNSFDYGQAIVATGDVSTLEPTQWALLREMDVSRNLLELMLPRVHHDKMQRILDACSQFHREMTNVKPGESFPSAEPINEALVSFHRVVRAELRSP